MQTLAVRGGRDLFGSVEAPADKSITHRAMILGALGRGVMTIERPCLGADNLATFDALSALGVPMRLDGPQIEVEGVEGPAGLTAPQDPIDCGNSGTTMRLLSGVLAATRFRTTLVGDDSLHRRPMDRMLALAKMGALISGRASRGKLFAPLTIEGAALRGQRHFQSVSSAQLKTALILAGCFATGESRVWEPRRSRDHTERMLRGLGVPLLEMADRSLRVQPRLRPWSNRPLIVAPDLSSASFLLAAAVITNSGRLAVRTGVNPSRAGFLEVLTRMGVRFERKDVGFVGGEPVAELRVASGATALRGTTISGSLTLRAIDEIPLIAALATFAQTPTTIADAAELRIKESDRIRASAELVTAFGGSSTETSDGLIIQPGRLMPGRVDSKGDHRIAMSAAVAALGIDGDSEVEDFGCADVSFPGFADTLQAVGANVEIRDAG